jgi:hypothetical protein
MTTLTNPDSWADLYSLIDSCCFEEVDGKKYLVIDWQDEKDYNSTTRTLLRRILREINRKIMRIYSVMEEHTCKLVIESVYTNITQEEYELAKIVFDASKDYEYDEEWESPCRSCVNPDHSSSSPSDDDSPSPQQPPEEDEPSLPSVASVD